jgi:hypothetical protein
MRRIAIESEPVPEVVVKITWRQWEDGSWVAWLGGAVGLAGAAGAEPGRVGGVPGADAAERDGGNGFGPNGWRGLKGIPLADAHTPRPHPPAPSPKNWARGSPSSGAVASHTPNTSPGERPVNLNAIRLPITSPLCW